MSEYTPTTENIRSCYVFSNEQYDGTVATPVRVSNAEFDRWLAQHDAAVRADQIEKDAAIAHSHIGGFGVSLFAENYTAKQVETAIRAQLKGEDNE